MYTVPTLLLKNIDDQKSAQGLERQYKNIIRITERKRFLSLRKVKYRLQHNTAVKIDDGEVKLNRTHGHHKRSAVYSFCATSP